MYTYTVYPAHLTHEYHASSPNIRPNSLNYFQSVVAFNTAFYASDMFVSRVFISLSSFQVIPVYAGLCFTGMSHYPYLINSSLHYLLY